MGFKGQLGVQLNIGNWVKLPIIFKPLTTEVMFGYTLFNGKEWCKDYKTTIISGSILGRYDITDLVLKLIGVEYPAFGVFGIWGIQFNQQKFEVPNRSFDPATAFGMNIGVGVKYNLQQLVGKPVEIDARFTQNNFLMGDVNDDQGVPFDPTRKYKHGENGFLLGVAYPF